MFVRPTVSKKFKKQKNKVLKAKTFSQKEVGIPPIQGKNVDGNNMQICLDIMVHSFSLTTPEAESGGALNFTQPQFTE